MGCVHREERFRPGFTLLAQPRCVIQEPNQVAVGVQVIFFCGFNQAVDHSTGLSAGRGVGKEPVLSAHHKGLCCARHGCWRAPACHPPDSVSGRATVPADSAVPCPGQTWAPFWRWTHLPMPTERPEPVSPVTAAWYSVLPASGL